MLTNGDTIVATACGDSLFTHAAEKQDAIVIASEPYDDDESGWTPVTNSSLVVATRTTLETGALP
jgi:predicted glutamine amidotransferase